MGANPNPTNISAPMWGFWLEVKKAEPKALLGGILALKPGYHSYRSRLPRTDYSVEEVANDRAGSAEFASAIDITLPTALMIKYSKRLEAAMAARDKRLFINGEPILREYIGTHDGKTVRCYMLCGGRAQGVGADAGLDWGRDRSHLWHIHLSVIRKFAGSADAFERLLSVWKGELYSVWARRHGVVVVPKPPAKPAKPVPPAKPGLPSYKNGTRTVREGMTGTDVRFIQRWIGPSRCGKADGKAGKLFTAGVRWYQGDQRLKVDGVVGPNTWARMLRR